MVDKVKNIKNPLTIIAIFAALAELASSATILGLDKEIQKIFIWFVIMFPLLLVVLFFLTLNFNHKVLYAPSDYKDETVFASTLKLGSKDAVEVTSNVNAKDKQENIINKEFRSQIVQLDDNNYVRCKFINCQMIYKGKGGLGLVNCEFDNCIWSFNDFASNTIQFLSSIYHEFGDGGKQLVENTFNNIRENSYVSKSE